MENAKELLRVVDKKLEYKLEDLKNTQLSISRVGEDFKKACDGEPSWNNGSSLHSLGRELDIILAEIHTLQNIRIEIINIFKI